VLAGLDAVRGDLRDPRRWRALQELADELLAPQAPGDWNQAMMELGATLCTPQAPRCLWCPIREFCEARKLGIPRDVPEKRKKRAVVAVQLAAAVFLDARRRSLLLSPPQGESRNAADDHVPSLVAKLWHFPTFPAIGSAEVALREFFRRELRRSGAETLRFEALEKVRHSVTYRKITVAPFLVRVKTLPRLSGAKQFQIDEITGLPISNLTRKVAHLAIASQPAGK